MRCPKCNSTALYGINTSFDKRNICAECGLSHEPGSHHASLYKQLNQWQQPEEEES